MRIFSFFLLSLFSIIHATAQEQAVKLVNEIYCLGTRTCSPHTSVEIELPPNTLKWFYTITASSKRRDARRIKRNQVLPAFASETASEDTDRKYSEPVFGDGASFSAYLLKHYTDRENFGIPGGVYFFYPEYSQKNTSTLGMVIDKAILCRGTQYIGLENPNAYTEPVNVYAVLTVVAIVRATGTEEEP